MPSTELATMPLTMSSLEIAGLASKRHDNVLRDADKMFRELGEGTALKFEASYLDSTGRRLRCLNLPKRECLILVSGYSVELRARIIDRWMQLEAALAQSPASLDLDAEVRKVLGGIVKSVVHRELGTVLPSMVTAHIAENSLAITDGVTAGEVCGLSKVATNFPRGVAGRVSRRLTEYCARNNERPRVTRLGRVRAQLFPTYLARDWLDIEGRALIRRWIDERSGQGVLRLVQKSDAATK